MKISFAYGNEENPSSIHSFECKENMLIISKKIGIGNEKKLDFTSININNINLFNVKMSNISTRKSNPALLLIGIFMGIACAIMFFMGNDFLPFAFLGIVPSIVLIILGIGTINFNSGMEVLIKDKYNNTIYESELKNFSIEKYEEFTTFIEEVRKLQNF